MEGQNKFTWWMPKGMARLTLYGSYPTRLKWIFGTWKIYLAYWKMYVTFVCEFVKLVKKEHPHD